jgi:type I restriction-modification system DNA methylase subunit
MEEQQALPGEAGAAPKRTRKVRTKPTQSNGVKLGFEATLWAAADKLRNNDEHIFWVPPEARWSTISAQAKAPDIGKHIDDAMAALGKANAELKRALPHEFGCTAISRLGELIDLISTIGLGNKAKRARDILGRVYEYFLSEFASAEGKKGGQWPAN